MKAQRRSWGRDELVLTFNLYCRIPFGRMHRGNPDVVRLAKLIGRTPSAVAMKLVNFASMDPAHQKRDVKGLQHASRQDEEIWTEFHGDWEKLACESQEKMDALCGGKFEISKGAEGRVYEGETEGSRKVRVRLGQRFFRDAVLSSYDFKCAVCCIGLIEMLNASHIIPWAADKARRVDPHNGISMCAFHDRAFDRGLIGIDSDYRIVLSKAAKKKDVPALHRVGLVEIEGCEIQLPQKLRPDVEALAYHRENVFRG